MKCWYCGKLTMLPDAELGKGWHKCSKCLATHIESKTGTGSPGRGGTYSTSTGQRAFSSTPATQKEKEKARNKG